MTVTTQQPHSHSHPHADVDGVSADMTRIQRLVMFLEAHFGDVELHMPEEVEDDPEQGEDSNEPSLLVSLDEADARINLISMVSRHHFCFLLFIRLIEHVERHELT
jgi:cleavage and polyadenylation specificity factor subunit 3